MLADGTPDKSKLEKAKKELSNDWKHYGVSDLAVDIGTTVIGGGIGKALFSGAVGTVGRLAARKNLAAAAQTTMSVTEKIAGTIAEKGSSAPGILGKTAAKAHDLAGTAGNLAKKANAVVQESRHGQEVLKHASPKNMQKLENRAEEILRQSKSLRHKIQHSEEIGKGLGNEERKALLSDAAKLKLGSEQIQGNISRIKKMQTHLTTDSPKHLAAAKIAGVAVATGMRQKISVGSQSTAKNSSDVRLEMNAIAEEMKKHQVQITAQGLLDAHRALKNMNLDPTGSDKTGLNSKELSQLQQMFDPK